MAVTYQSAGTVSYGSPIVPSYPASIAAGDLLILAVGLKTGVATVTTPEGWLALGDLVGTTGTAGADTGPTRIYLFAKVANGVEDLTGSLSLAGTWNSPWAQIYRFSNATGFWDLEFASGEDATGDATWSATMSTSTDIASGDFVLAASVDPTDVTHTYSAATVTATGATFGSSTIVAQPRSTNGLDIGGFIFTQEVTAGSSSSAAVVSASISGTVTNAYGPTALVRVREVAEIDQPTNDARLAATEVDVATQPDTSARLSGALIEVAANPESAARFSGLMIEVMTSIDKTMYPNSLVGDSAFGLPTVSLSGAPQEVSPNSLTSGAFGEPTVTAASEIEVESLGPDHALGEPALSSAAEIDLNSYAPGAAFGQPQIDSAGVVELNSLVGGAFGQPDLTTSALVELDSLGDGPAIGQPSVLYEETSVVELESLSRPPAFGEPAFDFTAEVLVDSLQGANAFGQPSVDAASLVQIDSLVAGPSIGSPAVTSSATISPDSLAGGAIGLPAIIAPTGVTPDEVMRLELDASSVDRNSCTALSTETVTDLGKAVIVESKIVVSRE